MTHTADPTRSRADETMLRSISQRLLWVSAAIVDAANRGRPNSSGVKVGGHQASSASMVDVMVALWFHTLTKEDRVSVKPHASPVLHAINYLLGDLDPKYLTTLRAKGGLQSYPSRLKDPDTVDFSTGSVGIGATAALWAAMAHRYTKSHFPATPDGGRFVSLLGDAELDEGAIWEAVADPQVASLGELLWVVDLNRQSLDRVVPDIQIERLQGMFAAAGWQVLTLKWGRFICEIFAGPGGAELRRRLEEMPTEEYQRMLRVRPDEIAARILADQTSAELQNLVATLSPEQLATAIRDLGGHDLGLLTDTFVSGRRPPAHRGLRLHRQRSRPGHRGPPEQPLRAADRGADAGPRGGLRRLGGRPLVDLRARLRRGRALRGAGRRPAAHSHRGHSAGEHPDRAGPPAPQAGLHPGGAGPAAGGPGPRRPGSRGAAGHLQPRRRLLDQPRRLDQQDRSVVGQGAAGLVRRRRRAGAALVGE